MTTGPALITSTANLTPAGPLGYAKGIAAAVAAALVAVVPLLPDGDWQQWAQIAVAVLGAVAVYAVPNQVKPVTAVTPPIGGSTLHPPPP